MSKHIGSCHCQKVRFEIDAEVDKVMQCNCSICARVGWLLLFVPAESFKLLSGQDDLKDYQFGKHHLHHTFCSTCGIHAFSSGEAPGGKATYAVNTRCLPELDTSKVEVASFDGKSR